MNKIHNWNTYALLAIAFSLLLLPMTVSGAAEVIRYALRSNLHAAVNTLFYMVLSIGVIALLLFTANRLACVIWVEDGFVKRKGLFGGFHKEVNIRDIQSIVIRPLYKEGDCLCLVDNSTYKFDRARRDSYICFPKTKANMEFVRSFWDKEIEEVTA